MQHAYIKHILDNGSRPNSVYQFAHENNLSEDEFYSQYGSFSTLEQDIFLTSFEKSSEILKKDEVYETYGARERVLALYYTWIEQLKANRSFFVFLDEVDGINCLGDDFKDKTREPFKKFIRKIIKDGIASQEISDRMVVTGWYKHIFWLNARFVLNFWLGDTSRNFEKTDAMVEKSVNFIFDLIQPNSLDSGFDLLKFLFQN